MKVLGLASYPIDAACTRYRLAQFIEPLAERGIELSVRPFMDSKTFRGLYNRANLPRTIFGLMTAGFGRLKDILDAGKFDAILIQREAMLFGPPFVEWIAKKWQKLPLVLDLDDATYIPQTSLVYGKIGTALKFQGKTDSLIKWAETVTCGNPVIARYVAAQGKNAVVIPTVVDTDKFCPRQTDLQNEKPIIGWIGTHSTFPFLQSLFPVLQDLARDFDFELKIVGAGSDNVKVDGVDVNNLAWKLERETADFQSLDIGLYPLVDDSQNGFVAGKSGFKAIQYMSVGVPFVVTPIGVCAEIGISGETHLEATTPEQWRETLKTLLSNHGLMREMGDAGRRYALQNYTLAQQADKLAGVLHELKKR